MKRPKIAFIYGTRPEIIKLSPIIRTCLKKKIPFFTAHTGQHYSRRMFSAFLEELDLPWPDYNLNIRSRAPYRQGDHTGRMMVKIEEILLKELPSAVLVQGDTNTVLAGALATSKISTTRSFTGFDIKLGHVESGLRSYDRGMPEEINRVMADHLSDFLFAPTAKTKKIAVSEGIDPSRIWVTGNTIVDAVEQGLAAGARKPGALERYGLKKGKYMLLTLHRQENVDDKKRLSGILKGVDRAARECGMPVVFPIHPRTVKKFKAFGVKPPLSLRIVDPCGFIAFLQMQEGAALVLTDSGGVQEEACVLRVPCVTLRDSTERPETVDVGANVVAGVKADPIVSSALEMISKKRRWKNPFGDGKAGEKIMKVIEKEL